MYYKVVFETNGVLESYARVVRSSEFCVRYEVGQWITPTVKNTKLYVFDSIANAMNWINIDSARDEQVRLFECQVKNPVKNFQIAYVHNIQTFWDRYFNFRQKRKKIEIRSHKIIPGTTGCSAVKLTKEIPIQWSY
jgi:hypothetical protein